MATKQKDASDGLLYIHSWPTGWQELIFHSKQHAADFLCSMNRGFHG
jgi:hypothetical protein